MADLDKVLKGLQAHADGCGYRSHHCDVVDCPYRYGDESCDIEEMCRDALELLKAYAKTEEQKQAERKQKRREWQAKYRESHRQQAYQTTKEWRKNNPEKWKAQKAREREKKRLMQKDGDGDV